MSTLLLVLGYEVNHLTNAAAVQRIALTEVVHVYLWPKPGN